MHRARFLIAQVIATFQCQMRDNALRFLFVARTYRLGETAKKCHRLFEER